MKFLPPLLLLLLSTQFVSCNIPKVKVITEDYGGFYDRGGDQCGYLKPGCNYYTSKGEDGRQITFQEDPYYHMRMPGDLDKSFRYTNKYGVVYEHAIKSRSGIIYDSWTGKALNNASDEALSRDIITTIAQEEEVSLRSKGAFYAKKFGLSQEQGFKIARTVNDFSTLQDRSASDIADFSQRLYGVNFSTLQPALDSARNGDLTGLNNVIEQAAENFGSSPETMREVVRSLHSKILDEAGIAL